uniref:Uric acid degradation bifunctional protein TTL n=1 Tax=Anthurium amnicola TaxID=1678845 RepID=A0A1D1ZEN1_9ARAE
MAWLQGEEDFKSCSGSTRFARDMAAAGPFADYHQAINAARGIWFNKVDVHGWLEAFAAHPQIGSVSGSISKWCKEEQSMALSTATDSTSQELLEWNARYKEKFGFVFLICASGRGMPEILAELKKRYSNRPIVELELAAQEEMKVIEIRLSKLFTSKIGTTTTIDQSHATHSSIAGGTVQRNRPPITTHVLDVSRGSPASGVEVQLEIWKGTQQYPSFKECNSGQWVIQGSSVTDSDGRSGPLMNIVDYVTPGVYRVSFNTRKYVPFGFFPYVSIVFEIKESQRSEHFHVPLLLSPFSFTTYRGS